MTTERSISVLVWHDLESEPPPRRHRVLLRSGKLVANGHFDWAGVLHWPFYNPDEVDDPPYPDQWAENTL